MRVYVNQPSSDTPAPSRRTRQLEAALSVATYSSCSVCMILLNKLLAYTYDLRYANSLLLCQNGGAVLLVTLAKCVGLIHYPDFDIGVVYRWLPLTVFFVLMLFTSLKSLETMSVPVQTVMKNLAIVFTAIGDVMLYGKSVTAGMYASFVLMILGSYLSAKGDAWVTAWGLFWTAANIVSTVLYTLYMKRLMAQLSGRIGRYGPVVYNNLLSLPFFVVLGGLQELGQLRVTLQVTPPAAYACLAAVTILSSMMTFAVFWCMEMTSPTTFSVVGALNKVPLTFLGMLIFSQYPTPVGYVGVVLALGAGVLYTYLNIRSAARKQAAAAAASSSSSSLSN